MNNRKVLKFTFMLALSLIATSCMSSINRASGELKEYIVYPGIKGNPVFDFDEEQATENIEAKEEDLAHPQVSNGLELGTVPTILCIVDIPFSFILDTILLPVDGLIHLSRSEEQDNNK